MATTKQNPVTSSFETYNTKLDKYNAPQSYLVAPSQNVLINDQEKAGSRAGMAYQAKTGPGESGSRVEASFDWINSTGTGPAGVIQMRADLSELLLRVFVASTQYPAGNYETLMGDTTPLTSVELEFDSYWDATNQIDQAIWVDGSTTAYTWSGGVATLLSIDATGTKVTCQGALTYDQQRFLLTGGALRIKDDNGTWHRADIASGQASTQITLSESLSAFPFSGGNLIVQEVVSNANFISSTNKMSFLRVVNNQAWIGCYDLNEWFISNDTAIGTFSFSTPRLPGEGAQVNTDGPGSAVGQLRGDVILHTGNGLIYKSVFNQITVGTTLCETLEIDPIKTTGRQAAQRQSLLEDMGNGLVWIGQDNVMYEFLDDTLAYNPKLAPVSDPVKPTFDGLDFGAKSGNWGHVKMFKNRIHISVPSAGIFFIYEYRLTEKLQQQWFWQPPQVASIKRFSIGGDTLYGHSAGESATYQMFTGLRDLGNPINMILALGRWNGDARDALKDVSKFFNEGGASENTNIAVTYELELDGGISKNYYKTIQPLKQPKTVYLNEEDPSLGNIALGDASISGDVDLNLQIPRFRLKHPINRTANMFDYGVQFQTNQLDANWYIMAHGSDATLSTTKTAQIDVP